MVGEELDSDYWFAKKPFREPYTDKIWWPHLVDRAAVAGVIACLCADKGHGELLGIRLLRRRAARHHERPPVSAGAG